VVLAEGNSPVLRTREIPRLRLGVLHGRRP
jgi:hypothetical protein